MRSAHLSTLGDVARFLELCRRDDGCIDAPAAEGIAYVPFFPLGG